MKTSILALAFGLGLLVSGAAGATDAAAPAASPSPVAVKPDKAALEARAQECKKESEVSGYTGRYRRRFIERCKRGETEKGEK